jgi:hypothetical protein
MKGIGITTCRNKRAAPAGKRESLCFWFPVLGFVFFAGLTLSACLKLPEDWRERLMSGGGLGIGRQASTRSPSKIVIPEGKALVWLELFGASTSQPLRTDLKLNKFEIRFMAEDQSGFWLVDSQAEPYAVLEHALDSKDDPLFLDPGTYKIHLIGYSGELPTVMGETDIFTLEEGKEEWAVVMARPVASTTAGIFTWTVTLPASTVSNAGFKIYDVQNFDSPVAVIVLKSDGNAYSWLGSDFKPDNFVVEKNGEVGGGNLVYSGYAELTPGEYYISSVVSNEGRLFGRSEVVPVFPVLESPVNYDFNANAFYHTYILSGTVDISLNGESLSPYVIIVRDPGLVSWNTLDERLYPARPITEAAWERQIQADQGTVLQFVAITVYEGIPFFRSTYTVTLGEEEFLGDLSLIDHLRVGPVNGFAQVAYTGTDGMFFYYVNIQIYADPECENLVTEFGLDESGAWTVLLPLQDTYYFRLQADLGDGKTSVKVEKLVSADLVDGTIDLGLVSFEGQGSSKGETAAPVSRAAASAVPVQATETVNQPVQPASGAVVSAVPAQAAAPAAVSPPAPAQSILAPASKTPAPAFPEDTGAAALFVRSAPVPPGPVTPLTPARGDAAPAARTQSAVPVQPAAQAPPAAPPEPTAPAKLSPSRDPQEVLDAFFGGQDMDTGYLIRFDEDYDPSFFDAITWEIDGHPLGEYTPILDRDGNPEKDEWGFDKFNFTPYKEAAVFLDYGTVQAGSSLDIKITVTKDGNSFVKTWTVRVP